MGRKDVCPLCYVLLGRGLCDGLIAHPEEFYRVRVRLSVIMKPSGHGGPGPLGTITPQKKTGGEDMPYFLAHKKHHYFFIRDFRKK